MTKYNDIKDIPSAEWMTILGSEDRVGFFLWRLAQFEAQVGQLEPTLVFVLLQEALAQEAGPTPSSTAVQQLGRMTFSALWHFPDADPPRTTRPRSTLSGLLWSGSAWYVSRKAPSDFEQRESWPGQVIHWGAENMTQFEFAAFVDWLPVTSPESTSTIAATHLRRSTIQRWPGILAESYIVMNTDLDENAKIHRLNQIGWRFYQQFHPRYQSGSHALVSVGWLAPLSEQRPARGILLNWSTSLWSLSPTEVDVDDFLDEDDADYPDPNLESEADDDDT